eukprot:CAMPEP_0171097554 /NCGR_PEP_ID=MMETSP0766_2-20121228/47614_1 /TAXON_ID=439317 /ORGANISM="Gambierdiscus australes, Strain CAWD 149" /LENGTH=184 /DNA_ID=CAMNT_0011556769 /DNA_START=53 /DNA_END=607 /DNA_ORIENTATION=+
MALSRPKAALGLMGALLSYAVLAGHSLSTGLSHAEVAFVSPLSTRRLPLGRRRVLEGLADAVLGLALVSFHEQAAWAIKDARTDSLCTFKCLDICNEKVPGNDEYCSYTCNNYCAGSEQEKQLQKKVGEGSGVDKILMRARKSKYVDNKQTDKKVSVIDTILGKSIVPNNETDFKNGIRETISR